MRMILVGPPGAGKGTQAARLIDILDIPHISTGDMFRAALKNGTEMGKKAGEFMARGDLVPDEIVIGMVLERIAEPDCSDGFMLDGFPRTLPQAEALAAALSEVDVSLDAIALIEVPDDLIVDRITGRRMDPLTGDIYHLTFNPPPSDEIARRLIQRPDDTEEACRARLAKYHSETTPVIPFYETEGIIRRVDGVGALDTITQRLRDVLGR